MSSIYEELREASQPGRQEVAARLIAGMRARSPEAGQAYYDLCAQVIRNLDILETDQDADLPREEFTAPNSALLVTISPARVSGFLRAIDRAPQAQSIIDAGTGSSALLAVAAAVSHPNAEIIGYEMNEPAARCAAAVVDMLGFSNRIRIEPQNVLTADLPSVDLAVTETFWAGLTVEVGTEITEALAHVSGEVLPAYAQFYASDSSAPNDLNAEWQGTTLVDLTARNDTISGQLVSTGPGRRDVSVYNEFLDARGDIVLEGGSKNLTDHISLGSIVVPHAGAVIEFSYRAGAELHQTPAGLRVA
jgi:hypothetical protein